MACKLLVITCTLLISQVLCAPPAAKPVEKSELENLASQAQQLVNDVTNQIQGALPDSKQVTEVLTTQTHNLAENVKSIVDKLQGQITTNKGDVDNIVKQVSDRLSETFVSLQKAAGPEATAKGSEIQQKLDDGLKTTVTEIEKLVKVVQPDLQSAQENISKLTKNVLDDFVKATQQVQTNVQNALQQAAKN